MNNNRITLKKLKHFKAGSQGTPCFTAIVCLDGEEILYADNDGRGGCNHYLPVEGKNWTHFKRIEEVAIAMLPDEKFEQLDYLLCEIMDDMEKEKCHQRQLKKCQFAIVGQKGDEYCVTQPYKEKIELTSIRLSADNEQAHLQNCVKKLQKQGYTVLNTNLLFKF